MAKAANTSNKQIETLADLTPDPRNARKHNPRNVGMLEKSLNEVGAARSIVIDENGVVLAGNATIEAAGRAGIERVQVVDADGETIVAVRRTGLTQTQKTRLALYDNRTAELADWDADLIANLMANERAMLDGLFENNELLELIENIEQTGSADNTTTLAERFGVPPFSVLDARQGYWQNRKRAWAAMGIKGELGREENLIGYSTTCTLSMQGAENTSIFDPVLCELAYRWFCPAGGFILDPFAGGSVRGIVAAQLGYDYIGIDLSKPQVAANEEQAFTICKKLQPRYIVGDSKQIAMLAPRAYDFLFSCPPYGDLEVYSTDIADLSTMAHDKFLTAYREIIAAAVGLLKPNRFACFVVGDFRDKKGFYRNFVANTIAAFQEAGATLYNEAILVTAVGSASMRASGMFQAARKLAKTHQNVLVFYNGDIKSIRENFGDVECGDTELSVHNGSETKTNGE